ncbi:hypothetical protein [Silicimonas sp. MF1-12-2]|uniref:hypothetical protein n=1 Tax=Silicimonas sp. MF1-12-2 TaxID=3384793 RepID=UPI0039B49CE4
MRLIAFSCLMLAIFAQPTFAQVSDAEIEACHAAPDTRCLTDIGTALALELDPPDPNLSGAYLLAQLGRLDEARSAEIRFQLAKGLTEAQARRSADYLVAPFRLIDLLRAGADLETAQAESGISGVAVSAALMRLSGMMATNTSLPLQPATDETTLAVLRWVATEIGERRYERLLSAEILAFVGEDDAARAIMDTLPADESTRTNISDTLARIVGIDRVLEIYANMPDVPAFYILRLAEISENRDEAKALLDTAMSRVDARAVEQDLARDLRTVAGTAAKLGFDDVAIEATERLRMIFRTTSEPEKLDPTWLAAALRNINAPEDEQRAALELAEQAVDRLPERFAGTASANLAGDYLRFGDAETAIRLLERNDPDPDDWTRLMSVEMPDDARTLIMAHVERTLSSEDMALYRAPRAASRAYQAESDSEKAAIRDEVTALLAAPVPDRTGIGRFYFDHLLKAADRLGDEELTSRILILSARDALDLGYAWPILQAAHQHRHFAEARRGNR